MNNEFEYYRIHRENNDSIPLLAPDTGNPDYLYEEHPIRDPNLMLYKLGKPIPRKPKMADYHSTPSSVISKKIFDVLVPLNIEGIQLLPARIRGKNDEIFEEYWAVHVYHNLKCLDKKLSDCIIDDLSIGYVKKLVLDKEILKTVPLSKRLVFRLGEDYSYQLYHISIVKEVLAVNPTGVRFTNIEEWNESSLFK